MEAPGRVPRHSRLLQDRGALSPFFWGSAEAPDFLPPRPGRNSATQRKALKEPRLSGIIGVQSSGFFLEDGLAMCGRRDPAEAGTKDARQGGPKTARTGLDQRRVYITVKAHGKRSTLIL